ncbi:hypothetical protein [Variovorax gossypii]
MNAVLDKPRAKAAKRPAVAKKIEPPRVTIADIRGWMGAAEEKLEMAYDAAERGEPIDTLLDHINHDVILEPNLVIRREDITQADAKRVYNGLFPVLACIQGAIKLAEGTVLHGTLEEAFALLDAAQTALDPVNDAVRALPVGGDEYDFQRGRDLAIKMLRECRDNDCASECQRRNRDAGARQVNIVGDYFVDAMCEQSLYEGFTSVLSGAIGPQVLDPEYFEDLTLAETQAGAAGEDGTQQHEGAEASEPTTALAPSAFEALGIEEGPYAMLCEAIAIIQARAIEIGSDLIYGVKYCAERGKEILSEGIGARDVRMCENASAPISVTIAVLEAALHADDDVALHGALRILDLAHESLDEAVARWVAA